MVTADLRRGVEETIGGGGLCAAAGRGRGVLSDGDGTGWWIRRRHPPKTRKMVPAMASGASTLQRCLSLYHASKEQMTLGAVVGSRWTFKLRRRRHEMDIGGASFSPPPFSCLLILHGSSDALCVTKFIEKFLQQKVYRKISSTHYTI